MRWDVYPPWTEIDDRQSNFDITTGQFVVASDGAAIQGVKVGRYLQTYSKRDIGPRFGFAYDVNGTGKTLVRANPTIDRWFDTSCFVPPTDITGTFGNAGRGIIRGPGSFNIDASLTKT